MASVFCNELKRLVIINKNNMQPSETEKSQKSFSPTICIVMNKYFLLNPGKN